MDHTRRLLLLPLWVDGNWFVMFFGFFFFFRLLLLVFFFSSFFFLFLFGVSRLFQIMFLPWLRGDTLQEYECLIPPLGLDTKSRFSSFLPPLRMISAPVSQDESLYIGRGFGRRGREACYSPSLLVAPTASGS